MIAVNLIGRIVRTPELRYTNNNKAVCTFTLACKTGKDTEFVNCVAWEKTADVINKYLDKGSLMNGEGTLKTTKWEDKQGNTKYKTEVVVFKVEFLDTKNNKQQDTVKIEVEDSKTDDEDIESDLPF